MAPLGMLCLTLTSGLRPSVGDSMASDGGSWGWAEMKQRDLPPVEFKEDLEASRCVCCGVPGCESPIEIQCRRHPDAPSWWSYFNGLIVVECAECGAVTLRTVVARRSNPGEWDNATTVH